MRELTIQKNDADQRLDRFLGKAVPLLPASLAQKYIRLKRIKVNGARAERDYRLCEGDRLQLYLNDEFFEAPSEENVYLTIVNPRLHIIYEDENIMLLDKPAGMVVHADEGEKVNTLVNHLLAYLYQKREWKPREENAFTPALCNRIDRNTGGIVIAAKNAEALRVLNEKIRERELSKFYLCICLGRPEPPKGRIECFLRKDSKTNTVRVYHHPVPDGRSAVTLYETLETRDRLSLVEVELLTRSARASPIWATPCSATENTASAASTAATVRRSRRSTPTVCASTSPPTQAFSTTCAGASSSPMRSPSGGNTSAEHAGEYIFNLYINILPSFSAIPA